MPDVHRVVDFLSSTECAVLLRELRDAVGAAATVTGVDAYAAVATAIRRTTRIRVSAATHDALVRRLLARRAELDAHFGVTTSACEEPQFLRYGVGDYFVAHQDGNTPLVHDDTRFRRISLVLFLNAQSEDDAAGTYAGGSLLLHGSYPDVDLRIDATGAPGTLVAFRPETTHEVTPVTRGERYTVAAWVR